jgi:hypothetical protein
VVCVSRFSEIRCESTLTFYFSIGVPPIGISAFAMSKTTRLTGPDPRYTDTLPCYLSPLQAKPLVHATFSLYDRSHIPYREFSYRDFATRDIKQMDLPNPESRCANTPMHTRVDYSTVPSPRRDFGLRGIANPNTNVFGTYLFPNPDMVRHLSSTNSSVAHSFSLSGNRVSEFRDSRCYGSQESRNAIPDARKG